MTFTALKIHCSKLEQTIVYSWIMKISPINFIFTLLSIIYLSVDAINNHSPFINKEISKTFMKVTSTQSFFPHKNKPYLERTSMIHKFYYENQQKLPKKVPENI